MKKMLQMTVCSTVLALVLCGSVFALRYEVKDLGITGTTYSTAWCVNDSGQVIGSAADASGLSQAFYRSADGTVTTLPAPEGWYSAPVKINASGQAVGMCYNNTQDIRYPFYYSPASGLKYVTVPGSTFINVVSITDSGTMAGGWSPPGERWGRSFTWAPDGTFTDISRAGMSTGIDNINSSGQAAGTTWDGYQSRAFFWDPLEGMTDIGAPDGRYAGYCMINDSGEVVTSSRGSDWTYVPSYWSRETGRVDLPIANGIAYAVNDAGVICGAISPNGPDARPFIWSLEDGLVDLSDVCGNGVATFINDSGQILGTTSPASGDYDVFFWSKDGGARIIRSLPGGSSATLYFNNLGQVAGVADVDKTRQSYFWSEETGLIMLDTLGGTDAVVCGLNDQGWLVGYSTTASGETRAVIWQPVPEPSSIAALFCGLGVFGSLIRRRKG